MQAAISRGSSCGSIPTIPRRWRTTTMLRYTGPTAQTLEAGAALAPRQIGTPALFGGDADRRGHVPAQPRVEFVRRDRHGVGDVALPVLAETLDAAHFAGQRHPRQRVERDRRRRTRVDVRHA